MIGRKGSFERGLLGLPMVALAGAIGVAGLGSWVVCVAEDVPVASDSASTIEREADKCLRAADAIALYTGFLAQADLPPDVRLQAEKKLELWKDRERKGLRKAGKDWVTPEELARRSTALIKAGLTFRKLGNKKFARNELLKASALDLASGTSEMWLGLFDVFDREYLSAMRHFQEAARREPSNAAAYSNAALSGFRAGRTIRVSQDFRCALERAGMGEGVGIAENISLVLAMHSGEFIHPSFKSIKSMPTDHLEDVKQVYADWLSDQQVDLESIARNGFTWFHPIPPPGLEGPQFADGKEVGRAIAPTIGGGTGFVIAPQFVITNAHVVKGADKITIVDPAALKKKTAEPSAAPSGDGSGDEIGLAAEVLFQDSKVDLALLKCTELAMPPLRMRLQAPRRGTELLSLGFPSFFRLGASIKSTGGKVVSEPEPRGRWKTVFYHDATINPGNSGGPLVDETAMVIGVACGALVAGGDVENAMYMGIPVEEVWTLLKSSGHDVPALEADSTSPMKWPDVDDVVSKSTVLVLVETKGSVRK